MRNLAPAVTGPTRRARRGPVGSVQPVYRCLGALAERPGDGLGGCAHAELGVHVREPLPNGVKAEEQLPSDVRLVLHRGGHAQHLGLARSQAKAVQRDARPRAGMISARS
jgi:hypothetical protein